MSTPVISSHLSQEQITKTQTVFTVFAREVGPLVKNKYPSIQKNQFNQILGRIWNELPPVEKNRYYVKADLQEKYLKQQQNPSQHQPQVLQIQQDPIQQQQQLPQKQAVTRNSPVVAESKQVTSHVVFDHAKKQAVVVSPSPAPANLVQISRSRLVNTTERHSEGVKDSHRPARKVTISAFGRFSAGTKMLLMKQYPFFSASEIEVMVVKMWQQLTDQEREMYNEDLVIKRPQETKNDEKTPEVVEDDKSSDHLAITNEAPLPTTPSPSPAPDTASDPLAPSEVVVKNEDKPKATRAGVREETTELFVMANSVKVNKVISRTENILMRDEDSSDEEDEDDSPQLTIVANPLQMFSKINPTSGGLRRGKEVEGGGQFDPPYLKALKSHSKVTK